jgi:AsmA family protein
LKKFSVAVDGASATLEGRIGEPRTPAALDLVASVQVGRAAGLEALAGQPLPGIPVFTASGRLTDVPDGYAIADFKFVHAATTISGDVAITRGAKRYKVTAKASSSLLDVPALMQLSGAGSAAKPKAGARAIPDLPLPLNVLRLVDADLDLRFDAVKFGETAPLGPLIARAVLADGRLKVEPAQLAAKADQVLNVSATIDATQNAWTLRAQGKGIEFGDLLARLGHAGVVTGGSTDVSIQLQGRGKSLAAVLGSLDGDARVSVGPHRIHNFAVNLHSGLLARVFSLANPLEKADPDTDVKCLAMRVPIAKGVITSERGVAVETAGYNLVLNGMLNLRTEAIDAAVVPVVGGKVRAVVRLGGTLAAPELGLDAASVARSAAGFGAGLATMGAWWLADAVLNRAASDPHPCATALAATVPSR